MLDYVRWIFRLNFCTRHLILRELRLEKLKIRWGIREMRFDKRLKKGNII